VTRTKEAGKKGDGWGTPKPRGRKTQLIFTQKSAENGQNKKKELRLPQGDEN